jgi:hypothetical protein
MSISTVGLDGHVAHVGAFLGQFVLEQVFEIGFLEFLDGLVEDLVVGLVADVGDEALCSPPSRLPAPRMSRSRMATWMPLPRSLNSSMACRRLREVGVSTVMGGAKQVAKRLLVGAAHAPAQLVQVAEAEHVCAVDDDGVGVRDVEAGFDDVGTHEHVVFAVDELHSHFLQLVASIWPWATRCPHRAAGAGVRTILGRLGSSRGCARRTPARRGGFRSKWRP